MTTSLRQQAITAQAQIAKRICQQLELIFEQNRAEELVPYHEKHQNMLAQLGPTPPEKKLLAKLIHNPQHAEQWCMWKRQLQEMAEMMPRMRPKEFKLASKNFEHLVAHIERVKEDLPSKLRVRFDNWINQIKKMINDINHQPQLQRKSPDARTTKEDIAKAIQVCKQLFLFLKAQKIDDAVNLCSQEYRHDVLRIYEKASPEDIANKKQQLAILGLWLNRAQQKIIAKRQFRFLGQNTIIISVLCAYIEWQLYFVCEFDIWKYDGELVDIAMRRQYLDNCQPPPAHLLRLGQLLKQAADSKNRNQIVSSRLRYPQQLNHLFHFLKHRPHTIGQWFVPRNHDFFSEELVVLIYPEGPKVVFVKEGPDFKVIATRLY